MRKKLLIGGGSAAAVAVALLVTAPGAEAATIPIGSTASSFTVAYPTTTYAATASSGRWSVVAGFNHKRMAVRAAGGGPVLRTVGPEAGDPSSWIAMDHRPGRRPTGTYLADVTAHVGAWGRMQFLDGGPALVSGATITMGEPTDTWLVDLREVRLEAGDELTLSTTGGSLRAVYVMRSRTTILPSTHTYSAATVDQAFPIGKPQASTDVTTVTFTARIAGNYAVLFENGWYDATAEVTPTINPAGT